jgi:hypothetical protein
MPSRTLCFTALWIASVLVAGSIEVWAQAAPLYTAKLPWSDPIALQADARFACKSIQESSGVVASGRFPGVLWTHNDSGDGPVIFAFRRDGSAVQPAGGGCSGIRISGAENVDWEDIASDGQGNLILGDIGNNANERRDLSVYLVAEPDPKTEQGAVALRRVKFRYPDQEAFPPRQRNFDSEAIFWADGALHLITKHRSDTMGKLYRFPSLESGREHVLDWIATFDFQGRVTGADASADGLKLAVLTYTAVWVFSRESVDVPFFAGTVSWLPIQADKCEAIAFADDGLVITNEEGRIFSLPLDRLLAAGRGQLQRSR